MKWNNSIATILIFFTLLTEACSPAYFNEALDYTEIKAASIKPSSVRRLNLSHQNLKELPHDIRLYVNMTYIDLSNNPGINLENSLSQLAQFEKLEVIILDSNQLISIPENIGEIKSLRHLSLSHNPGLAMESLIESIETCSQLRMLDLSDNDISNLPASFEKLTGIRNLRLSNNRLIDAENFSILVKLKDLRILWLDGNQITLLPSSIGELKVVELYLDNNSLKNLPKEISECDELRVLYLGNNLLKEIPEEVINMKMLKFLVLNQNHIQTISTQFEKGNYPMVAMILDQNKLSTEQLLLVEEYFGTMFLISYKNQRP